MGAGKEENRGLADVIVIDFNLLSLLPWMQSSGLM